jgi:hypothetical protein
MSTIRRVLLSSSFLLLAIGAAALSLPMVLRGMFQFFEGSTMDRAATLTVLGDSNLLAFNRFCIAIALRLGSSTASVLYYLMGLAGVAVAGRRSRKQSTVPAVEPAYSHSAKSNSSSIS